ncbi:helix-turn-helix transcriptional regulator [Lachnospiraceae bacterium 54-11]
MANLPVIDMIGTGQNIARLRKQAGLSVRDLQDVFGFATPQAIYKWQQGAALPTLDNLVVLAAVLQVRMDDILVITDPGEQIQISA